MRNRILRVLCSVLALPLAGCAGSGIPDWDDALYQRVLSGTGEPSSNETASHEPGSRPPEPRAPDASALIGDKLTLNEAVRFAVLNHPDLRRSASAVRAAGGRELQAGLYPNPAFNFEAEALGAEDGEGGETSYLFEQELVTTGKRRKARAVAEADRLIRQAAFRETEFQVATQVRRAFANASATAERRAAQRALFDLATELLDAAEAQVDAGAARSPTACGLKSSGSRRRSIFESQTISPKRRRRLSRQRSASTAILDRNSFTIFPRCRSSRRARTLSSLSSRTTPTSSRRGWRSSEPGEPTSWPNRRRSPTSRPRPVRGIPIRTTRPRLMWG